ncbi:MAG TPA: sugar nucleotide-binding protein, partial [Burkholderiales bacterium]|nr:sugar nucleotide-binding protein [Burkholderiales bacterium]
ARNSRELAALSGIYHLTAAGSGSWYDFAKEIFGSDAICENRAALGLRRDGPRIVPISSESYGAVAARPANSALNCEKAEEIFEVFRPEWRDFLALCVRDMPALRGR